MIKKVVSLLMVFILAAGVFGCSGGGGGDSGDKLPAGGTGAAGAALSLYDEIELGGNSGIVYPEGSRINSKNQLVVFDRGGGANGRFVTLDKEGKPVGEIKCSLAGLSGVFDLDAGDNIFALLREKSGEDQTVQKIAVIDPSGKVLNTYEAGKYSAGGSPEKQSIILDLALDKAGNIYLATLNGIRMLDKNGKERNKAGSDAFYSIDADKDGNIVAICFGAGKQALVKIDPSTGKSIWSTDIADASGNTGTSFSIDSLKIRFDPSDSSYCLMNANGVRRFDSEGKPAGTVLDFLQYLILASGNIASGLNIDAQGNFYITTVKDNKYEIFRYDIEGGTHAAKKRAEITVAVPVSQKWLETAAVKFRKANPGYAVNIKAYEQEARVGGDYENYIKALNTELLTGKGPDLFYAGGLSTGKYIEKNLLEDLGALMARDGGFDDSHYYTNIFNALKYKDKLYTLPVSVSFNVLAADKKILEQGTEAIDDSKWSWQDFKAAGERLAGENGGKKGRRVFMPLTGSSLLGYLLQGNYGSFLDLNGRKAQFNSKEFVDLLEISKAFSTGDEKGEFSYSPNYSDIDAIEKGEMVFNPQTFSDYTSYAFLKALYNDRVRLLKYPSAGTGEGGVFSSPALFALNANSGNKDAAWEFLKLLLSEEVQTEELGGFAVHRAALAKTAQSAVRMTESGGMAYAISTKDKAKPKIVRPKPLTKEDISYINSFIEAMGVYDAADTQAGKIVSEEAGAYFSGGRSAEETAKLIQQKVELYLGE